MIKLIKHIHYKSFDNLDTNIEFKQINLIFGYNGQGKSSFVDFIRNSIENRTLENFECSQTNYKLFVYDEKYKRNTLYIDDDEKDKFISFYAGENIKNIVKSKKKIENKIAKLESHLKGNETALKNIEADIEKLKITIAKETRIELEKINSNQYKIPQSYTKSQIQNEMFEKAELLSDSEFETAQKYKADNEPKAISIFMFNLIKQISPSIIELEKILKQTPQNKAIKKFKKDSVLENFAKTALEIKNKYPQEYNEKCPLCEQNVITIKLWENLEQHFNKEYDQFIDRLEKANQFFKSSQKEAYDFIEWLNQNLIETKLLLREKTNVDKLRQEFLENTQSFIDCLKSVINAIQAKIQTPNRDDIVVKFNFDLNNIIQKLQSNQIADIVEQHNEQQKVYSSFIDKNTEKIKQHFIAKQKEEFKELQNKIKMVNHKLRKRQKCKNKRKEQIEHFDEQLRQADESFKNLNKDLKEWFFEDIRFEKLADSHYKTQRQDCNGKWFDCKSGLSEGEKTIISIIYFTNSYLATLPNLQECPILIIDDPITSLDHIKKGCIINYILNKIISNRPQIFILSHEKAILYKINKRLNSMKFSDKKLLFNVNKEKFSSKINVLEKISIDGEAREIYIRLRQYISNPTIDAELNIMQSLRNLLEKIFSIIFEDDEDFTKCYDIFLKKIDIIPKYSADDIQKLNHNKNDEDLSPEILEKCKFVVEVFEKFTKKYSNQP